MNPVLDGRIESRFLSIEDEHGGLFMTESKRIHAPKVKRVKKQDEETGGTGSSSISEDAKKRKLQELDEFMEDVLEKAGEEFLDEFRQVEGE